MGEKAWSEDFELVVGLEVHAQLMTSDLGHARYASGDE